MRYVLLIYTDEKAEAAQSKEQQDAVMAAYWAFGANSRTRFVGDALLPTSSATTVRLREGKTLTTDGPFAETKEQLGGYYVVKCDTLDEATEIAATSRRGLRRDRGAPDYGIRVAGRDFTTEVTEVTEGREVLAPRDDVQRVAILRGLRLLERHREDPRRRVARVVHDERSGQGFPAWLPSATRSPPRGSSLPGRKPWRGL